MIRFMSKAAASFVMTEDVAQQVLKALGEDGHVPGIWVVERLPDVIAQAQSARLVARQRDAQTEAQLQAGIEAFKSRGGLPESAQAAQAAKADQTDEREWPVGLSRRLVPVLEMLERARAAAEPVVWERD